MPEVLPYDALGDSSLLQQPLYAFLCSQHIPAGTADSVTHWINTLPQEAVVLCGNLTGIEQMALRLLASHGNRVVLVLATSLPKSGATYYAPLVIAPRFEEEVTKPSAASSAQRNELMISMASHVVVGYMAENGHLARQLLLNGNVTILQASEGENPDKTAAQNNATQMGWTIYKQLQQTLPSLEMRRLLQQYLKLDIERPSLLHSLVLFTVVKQYGDLPDFNFTAFFHLWGFENLRPDDWKSVKVEGKWMPALTERVITRLFNPLPSKFRKPVNPDEHFDPQLAHLLVDAALRRSPKNKKMLKRALNLAYFEHDGKAIARYKDLLK